jgi:hypothetical protein
MVYNKEKKRQYALKNKEKIQARMKEYRQRPEVKEYWTQYNRQYRLKNREKLLAQKKEHSQRPEVKEHKREWYLKNIEKILAQQKSYRQRPEAKVRDRERHRRPENKAKVREWYLRNRERILADDKEYNQKPEVKDRSRKGARRLMSVYREKILSNLGGKCVCCGETELHFLSIDHVRGGGNRHRKSLRGNYMEFYREIIKEGYPRDKYQVLCMNCNWATRFGDPCPHELETYRGFT